MSKRLCSICARTADVDAINAQLLAGMNQKFVAGQFPGMSRFALSRHWRNCLATPPPATESGNGDSRAEISKWLQRADDQYQVAQVDADQRGAVASLVAGLRATEALVRSEERAAKLAPEAEAGAFTLSQLDQLFAAHEARATPESELIDSVMFWLRRQVDYSGDPRQLNLILGFLKVSLAPDASCLFAQQTTNAQLIADFEAFVARRVAEGDRCDLPRRNDEPISQVSV
jgi:hypothetical protein